MFKNRLFNLMITAVSIAVIALAAQQAFAKKAIVPDSKIAYAESKEQALREVQLGERYGAIPQNAALFSVAQIQGEYILGERYGVLPDQIAWLIAEQKIRREYMLGERYGQMP